MHVFENTLAPPAFGHRLSRDPTGAVSLSCYNFLELTQLPFSYNCTLQDKLLPILDLGWNQPMKPQAVVDTILDENRKLLADVSEAAVDHLIESFDNARRVFCAAQGRSGFILRCFCMRLMQLGYSAFFVGETITPGIQAGDMLFVLSGSGQTPLTLEWIKLARERGATRLGVVGKQDSPIGKALDYSLSLSTASRLDVAGDPDSIQPPGSLFEQAAFFLLESIALALYQRQGSDAEAIRGRHANLE
jgi:6-phospho-3-hexuloisomerase